MQSEVKLAPSPWKNSLRYFPSIFYSSIYKSVDDIFELINMDKPCTKSILVGDNQRSFRSSRTTPLYNIQDYLPPTGLLSRTVITQPRTHKIYTQPTEHIAQLPLNDHRIDQLNKKIESLSYEKEQAELKSTKYQRRVQALQNEEKVMQQRIRNITQKLDSLQRTNNELNTVLNMKPSLELDRNCSHFILYPKHQQRYEVSIQTDPIQTTPAQVSPFITESKYSDRQMLQIQEKLSQLAHPKPSKKQTKSTNSFKARFTGARQDKQNNMKQNNMRVSNTFDRMGTVPDEKIREENMEVLPIDNEKLERLIQLYMD